MGKEDGDENWGEPKSNNSKYVPSCFIHCSSDRSEPTRVSTKEQWGDIVGVAKTL